MSRTIIRIFDDRSFDSIICTCGRCKDSAERGCHHTTSIAIGTAGSSESRSLVIEAGAESLSLPPPSPPPLLLKTSTSIPPPPPESPPPPPPLLSAAEYDRDSIDPSSDSDSDSDSDVTVGEAHSDSESSTVYGGSCSPANTAYRFLRGGVHDHGESRSRKDLPVTQPGHEPTGVGGTGRDRPSPLGTISTSSDRAGYDTGYHSVKDVDIDAIPIVKTPSVAALMAHEMPDAAITFPLPRERAARGFALRRCESVGSGDLLRGARMSCVTLKNRIQSAFSFRAEEEREKPRRADWR